MPKKPRRSTTDVMAPCRLRTPTTQETVLGTGVISPTRSTPCTASAANAQSASPRAKTMCCGISASAGTSPPSPIICARFAICAGLVSPARWASCESISGVSVPLPPNLRSPPSARNACWSVSDMLVLAPDCSEPGTLECGSESFIDALCLPRGAPGCCPMRQYQQNSDKTAHAGEQLIFAKWLGHIEVGAPLQPPAFVQWRVLGAYQDDGNIAALLHLLQLTTQLKAVLFGQNDVEHNALWSLLEDLFKRLLAVHGGDDVIAALTQRRGDERQISPTVVNDQDSWHGHARTPCTLLL